MARVHPSAVVDPGAVLADSVVVGPLCHVGADVELGPETELLAQATVLGPCRLGRGNRIFPHATLGADPQDRSFAGEETLLVVGDDNVFRECVTVHRGTKKGGGRTTLGSSGLYMVGVHVGHDATVGDHVTFANQTSLGGHVTVEDRVVLGGHVAVAPFVRIGEMAFAAGGAMIERDVPPYLIVAGDRARIRGLNRVGLSRGGVPDSSRAALDAAYRILFHSDKPLSQARTVAEVECPADPYVRRLLAALSRRT